MSQTAQLLLLTFLLLSCLLLLGFHLMGWW